MVDSGLGRTAAAGAAEIFEVTAGLIVVMPEGQLPGGLPEQARTAAGGDLEALRSYAEKHVVALTLQRSFLPSALPELPGIELSARYVPASDQAEVGGDFYEVLVRDAT